MVDSPAVKPAETNPVPKDLKPSRAKELMTELNSYHEIVDKIDTNIYGLKREIKSSKREKKLALREAKKLEKLIQKEDYNG